MVKTIIKNIKHFKVEQKISRYNIDCMMRKTILHYECCKSMLTANIFVK